MLSLESKTDNVKPTLTILAIATKIDISQYHLPPDTRCSAELIDIFMLFCIQYSDSIRRQ
jgi:hypothetical protein